MPKIKVPRSSPSLDMTPMVDLAFILLTFFMLTASFRAPEPLVVDTPSSTTDKLLPDNVMMITIDTAGRVYYNINGKDVRRRLLDRMTSKYADKGIRFTEEEKHRFSLMTTFGLPIKDLRKYIQATETERGVMDKRSSGIPIDSLNNELNNWIYQGYAAYSAHMDSVEIPAKGDKALRYAIKADGNTDFKKVQRVLDIFSENNIHQFNLITDLEDPSAL